MYIGKMSGIYKTKYMAAKLDVWREENKEFAQQHPNVYFQRQREYRDELWEREVEDAKAQAYLKCIKDAEALYLRQRVEDGDFEGMPELEAIYSKIKNRRSNGGALYRFYWVTVNVAPGVGLADLQAKIEKYVHRKIVKRAEWVIEQRGKSENTMGEGMHMHMLVEQSGALFLGDFTRNTRNTFKTLVGNDLHVHVLGCKSEKDVEARRKYMQGEKVGKTEAEGAEKREKCAIDKVWRLKNNILPMYIHENGTHGLQEETSSDQESRSQKDEDDISSTYEGSVDDEANGARVEDCDRV